MNSGRQLIEAYYRRGWLSPGKFVAAIGLERDLESVVVPTTKPEKVIAAKQRIDRARELLEPQQLEMLWEILLTTDASTPAAWARLNGLAERQGLRDLRLALGLLVPIYVEDGTE